MTDESDARAEPLAVLGLGGVGGMLAARTGALCVGTEQSVAAIRERGLRLDDPGGTTVAHPRCTTRLDEPVALLVVAVKARGLEAALERIAPAALERGTVVLPLLNGLEHVDDLRRRLGGVVVAAGSIGGYEGVRVAPGHVVQRSEGAVVTAACDGLAADALRARLRPLDVPGLQLVVGPSERAVLWEKAVRLAVLAAATVATGRTVGELRDDATWSSRLRTAVEEACATAAAEGVLLDPAAQWAIIEAMPHERTTSAARDAAAGVPTELDAITGSVLRAGERADVPTPALRALLDAAEERCRAR